MSDPRFSTLDRVRRALDARELGRVRSFSEPVSKDPDAPTLGEVVPDPTPSPEEQAEVIERRAFVHGMLGALQPSHAALLALRYGIGGNDPLTLQEIGDRVGRSRERIRQIEAEAFKLLRERAGVRR